MRKNEKRIAQKQLGLFMGRRTEARKIVFGGPVRNSGFGVATSDRLSQKDRSDRDWSSPHDFVAAPGRLSIIKVLKSPYTSRCEEMSQKPKSNREKPAHNAKPRRRNIQSASRAYEKRRKRGSVSPRRERRPRPHSAKVGMSLWWRS